MGSVDEERCRLQLRLISHQTRSLLSYSNPFSPTKLCDETGRETVKEGWALEKRLLFPFAMAQLLELPNLGLYFTASGPRQATPYVLRHTHFERGKNDSSYACSSLMDRYPVPSSWTRMTRPVTPPAMGMFTSGSLSGTYTE